MSWLREWYGVIIIIIIVVIGVICLFGFLSSIQEKEKEFCELHNFEYEYGKCFEIKGNKIIDYPIREHNGRYYFVNKEN